MNAQILINTCDEDYSDKLREDLKEDIRQAEFIGNAKMRFKN